MCIIFLRFEKSLLAMWLNIRTKLKIIYIVFLSINFLQIATRLATTCVIRPNAIPPKALSLNKLVLL